MIWGLGIGLFSVLPEYPNLGGRVWKCPRFDTNVSERGGSSRKCRRISSVFTVYKKNGAVPGPSWNWVKSLLTKAIGMFLFLLFLVFVLFFFSFSCILFSFLFLLISFVSFSFNLFLFFLYPLRLCLLFIFFLLFFFFFTLTPQNIK